MVSVVSVRARDRNAVRARTSLVCRASLRFRDQGRSRNGAKGKEGFRLG